MFKKLNDIRAKKGNKKGFTLVELIVVIVIILILAAVLVPNVLKYVEKANEASCKSDATAMLTQLQADYAANQAQDQMGTTTFPSTFNGITLVNDPGTGDVTADTLTAANTYSYHVTTSAGTTLTTSDITSFVYRNAKYTALWSNGKWTVSKNS